MMATKTCGALLLCVVVILELASFHVSYAQSITKAEGANLPASGDVYVTISGLTFGTSDSSPTMYLGSGYNGLKCDSSQWTSSTTIQCQVRARSNSGNVGSSVSGVGPLGSDLSSSWKEVDLYAKGSTAGSAWNTPSSNSLNLLTFDAPVASYLAPLGNAPTSGYATVTLVGTNFGAVDYSFSKDPLTGSTPTNFVMLGSSLCESAIWKSETAVQCTVPPGNNRGVGTNGQIGWGMAVTVQAVVGTRVSGFTYDAPVLSATPRLNAPSTAANTMTLFGANFGMNDPTPTSQLYDDDGATLSGFTTSWTTNTYVQVARGYVPGKYGTKLSMRLTVAAIVGTRQRFYTFDAPSASGVNTWQNMVTSSASSVTISGLNFGGLAKTPTAVLDVSVCGTTSWSSATTVSCAQMGGAGYFARAVLTVASITGTSRTLFTFDAPTVSYDLTGSSNMPPSGALSVTISGLNFGARFFTPSFRVGSSMCQTTAWTSGTTVACASPLGFPSTAGKVRGVLTISSVTGTSGMTFSFDAPAVSYLVSFNGPPAQTQSVTVTGLAFGYQNPSPTIRMGQTLCMSVAYTATTSVTCVQAPTFGGSGKSAVVTISAVVGTRVKVYTFDAPVLTDTVQNLNAPTTQGATLTLAGVNFGMLDATPTVGILSPSSPELCATTSWNTQTTLMCTAPATAGGKYKHIAVTVAAVVGTRHKQFTFDAPVSSHAMTMNLVPSGTATLTLLGLNFGGVGSTPTVGLLSGPVTSEKQTLTFSAGSALGGSFTLQMNGATTSAISAPASAADVQTALNGLSTVSSCTVERGGTDPALTYTVTFDSAWLGDYPDLVTGGTLTPGDAAIAVAETTKGVAAVAACTTTSWSTSTSVTCSGGITGPMRASKIGNVIAVGAVVGTRAKGFSFDAPTASSLFSNSVMTGMSSVTISGLNFGYRSATPTATMDGTVCTTTTWTSSSTVACATGKSVDGSRWLTACPNGNTCPSGKAISSLGVRLTVSAVVGTTLGLFSFDAPVVSYTSVRNLPSCQLVSLTLSGVNFGLQYFTPTVNMDGGVKASCASTSWSSVSSVYCMGNQGYGVGAKLAQKVTIGVVVGTSAGWFTFDAPVLTGWRPYNAAQAFFVSVTLAGLNFGAGDATASISFGSCSSSGDCSKLCSTSSWTAATTMLCFSAKQGFGSPLNTVHVAAVVGTRRNIFTFDAAVPTLLIPPNSATTTAGTITLTGVNFASANYTPTVAIGPTIMQKTTWVSITSLVVESSPGYGAKRSAIITVGAVVSTQHKAFSFDSPVLSYDSGTGAALNIVTSGTTSITIAGLNFGPLAITPTLRIVDQSMCTTTAWTSATTAQCSSDKGYGKNLVVAITTSSLVGTVMGLFTFDSPAVSYFRRWNMAATGGASITLTGYNFASVNPTLTASIGSTACLTASWNSLSSVKCQGPPASGKSSLAASLTVSSLVGTTSYLFTYDAPVITQSLQPNGPTTGGLSLTLSGVNLGSSDATPTVRLSANMCQSLDWKTTTSIICQANYGKSTERGKFAITIGNLVGTTGYLFSYDAPVPTQISEFNSAHTGSQYILISGHNFEGTDLTPTVMIGTTVCGTTHWTTATSIACTSNYGQDKALSVNVYSKFTGMRVVSTSGSVNSGASSRTQTRPDQIGTEEATAAGVNGLTITGVMFGTQNYTPTMFFENAGSFAAVHTTSWTTATSVIAMPQVTAAVSYQAGPPVVAASPKPYPSLARIAIQAAASFSTYVEAFSYDTPVLTSTEPHNAPVTEGGTITLRGLNFGNAAATPTLRLGDSNCGTTSWTTSTLVTCSPVNGVGTGLSARLTLSQAVGTRQKIFSFDAPVITDVTQNGPDSGGSSVTVIGLNFATYMYTPTAVLGNTQCLTSTWNTATKVLCTHAPGAGADISTSVTLASLAGTMLQAFTYDSPVVSYDKHPNLPSTQGGLLTIEGVNFGYSDRTPTAKVSSTACASSIWVSSTHVTCAMSTGTGYKHSLIVTVDAVVGTKTMTFTFDAPVTSFLYAFNKPVTAGSSVTIFGTNFGSADTTVTATLGSSVCGTTVWTTDSSVKCALQQGSQGGHDLLLYVTSLIATRSSRFSYDAPVLTFVSERNGPTSSGTSVTISGTGFGMIDYTVTAQVGSSVCETTSWMTSTKIDCVPPKTTGGAGLRVVTTLSSFVGTTAASFTYDAPVISRLVAINAPTLTGAYITLEGFNFGTPGDVTPTAQIGSGSGTKCGSTSWVSTSLIVCRMTRYGTGKRRSVVLSLGGQSGTKSRTFSYDSPVITHLGRWNSEGTFNAPTSSGASITMIGLNFGGNDFSPTARVGLSFCPTASWTTASVIKCLSPGSAAFLSSGGVRQTHVAVDLHTLMGTLSEIFTYDAPIISFHRKENGPTAGGGDVTMDGLNFATFNSSPTASLGSTLCSSSVWVTTTSVVCTQPAGHGMMNTAVLTIDTIIGTQSSAFTYDIPLITNKNVFNTPTSGSSSVSILGLNFATSDVSATVRMGATTCGTTTWTSNTQLVCLSKSGSGAKRRMSVTIETVVGTAMASFSYNAPVISAIDANNGPTTSGVSITLHGTNFGIVSLSPSIRLGSSVCGTSSYVSGTSLTCYHTWKGYGTAYSVATTISAVVGTKYSAFTFDAPVVTSAHPLNSPSSGTISVTLVGTNFIETYNYSPSATLGTTLCATTSWQTNSMIVCGGVQGTGKEITMPVQVQNRYGTGISIFTYDSPVVSYAEVTYGNPSGGFSVTLSGTNFGYSNFQPSALLGESVCDVSTWVTSTSIVCGGPAGFGNNVPVSIALDEQIGSLQNTFTYAGPIVSYFLYQNGPTSGGASVSLQGENFGISDPTPTVVIGVVGPSNTQRCLTASWYTVTSVICAATADAGVSKTVRINVGDNIGTATNLFTYDQPIVTQVKQPNGPTSGMASVTLVGVNFGNFDFSLSSRVGSTSCGTVSWNAASTIVCLSSAYGDGTLQLVSVTVDNVVGTLSGAFSFDAPVVTTLFQYNLPTSAGGSLSIVGTQFSMFDKTPTIMIGATVCGTTSWSTQTYVRCESPQGGGRAVNVNAMHEDVVGTGLGLFSYDAPVVTRSVGYNGASTGGYILTVSGANFGVNNLTPSVKIGITTCRTSTWSSLTSLLCGTAPGYGKSLHTTASVSRLAGTYSQSFTYDAPVVTKLSHNNQPSTSGASITIYGNQFGFEDTTPLPRVGVTRCATTSWNSETTLVCRTADGKGVGHSFALTVGVLVGTLNSYFTYDAPVLTFPARPNAPTSGSTSLTLYGFNFGLSDLSDTAEIGPTVCETTSWTSASMLTCISPVSRGAAVHAGVKSGGGLLIGTALAVFTYDSPVISTLRRPNGASSGTSSITLVGTNFVVSDLTPSVTVGTSVCLTATWTSATNVKCSLKPGFAHGHTTVLTMAGLVGTRITSFSYDSPALTYVHLFNLPLTGSYSVTINGFNFGLYDNYSPTIKFGSTYCPTASWTSVTALMCLSSPGTGIMQYMGLTLGSQVGTGSNLFSYDSPAISIVERNNSPSTAGTIVTLKGTNFGTAAIAGTAGIGTTACTATVYTSSSSLTCTVPQGAGSYLQASLSVNSNVGTLASTYSYDAPIVTFVDKFNAPASTGAQITVSGFNYGFEDFTPSVRLGYSQCGTTTWSSLTLVTCLSPAGQGISRNVVLSVNSIVGTHLLAFTFDAPIITRVNVYNAPSTTGMSVTVTGLNFAAYDFTNTVMISGVICTTSSWSSSTTVSCLSSPSGGYDLPLEVILSGNSGTGFNAFTYDSAVMSRVSYSNAASSAAVSVTIQGLNFGQNAFTPTLSIGTTACTTTSWTTYSHVICLAAAGSGFRSITASVSSHVGTGYVMFTYDTPVLSDGLRSLNAVSSGATSVTLTGLNFASMDNTASVKLGTFQCATTSWQTQTSAQCLTASGNGNDLFVTMIVDEDVAAGTGHALFTYDSPVITRVARSNAPTSGSGVVTMHGLNFGVSDKTSTISLAVTACLTSVWTTDTSVMCTTAFGTGKSREIAVTVAAHVGTQHIAFSYDSAAITYVAGRNGPTTGGTNAVSVPVTITGMNFGVPDATPTVAIGNTACHTSSWTSITALMCLQNPGTGKAVHVAMTVSDQIGSATGAFTYDAPTVTYVAQRNAPTTGGTVQTLHGMNFGLDDSTPSVRMGLTACTTTVWTSETQVLCTTASGSGPSLHAAVTVNNVPGTHVLSMTYDAPVVTFINAYNAPPTGSTSVTVFGTNFGASKMPAFAAQLAQLGQTACKSNYWISQTQMVCSVSHGVGAMLNANVILTTTPGTGILAYTYDSPVVTYVSRPNGATSGGSSLTIRGSNFAPSDFSSSIAIGATVCMTSVWRTDSIIVCQLSAGIKPALHGAVTVGRVVGTAELGFTYDAPVVTRTVPKNAPTSSGGTLTVSGTNFGMMDGSKTVSVGGTACACSIWTANSVVKCVHPIGTGLSKAMGVTVQGLAGQLADSFTFDSPVVTFTTHSVLGAQNFNAPTSADLSVTITGFDFGMSNLSPLLNFGGKPCDTTSWVTVSALMCNSISGSGAARLSVAVDSVIGTGPDFFTYDAPAITDLTRPNTVTTAAGSVTMMGLNFGPEDFSMSVRVGLTSCQTSSWTSVTSAACHTPAGTGTQSMQLSLSSVVGTGYMAFSYDAPAVSHAMITNNPTTGGGYLTLFGNNFGVSDVSLTAGIPPSACASTTWASDTSIACMAPAGSGTSSNTVTVSALVGTLALSFTYDAPSITRLHVPNVPTTSGATVTLMGTNFGPTSSGNTIFIGETRCSTTYWATATQMVCGAMQGTGEAKGVVLEVSSLVGTFYLSFTYDTPVVTVADPLNMPTTAGVSITISGTNFGLQDSSFTMAIGETPCVDSIWISTTALSCRPAVGSGGHSGAGAAVSATVLVSAIVGTAEEIAYGFTYDSPVVTYAGSIVNGPTSGGSTLTLSGMNFGFLEYTPVRVQAGVVALSECTTTAWVSDTSLTCAVPMGIGTMRHIAVAYQKNIGTLAGVFTYDGPVLTHLSRANGPTSGTTMLTINGINLGAPSPYAGQSSTSASLYPKNTTRAYVENDLFDSLGSYTGSQFKQCESTAFVSSSQIVCTTPLGSGAARSVRVEVEGVTVQYNGVTSNYSVGVTLQGFSYDGPVLTLMIPANGPITSGASLTLVGKNFGNVNSAPQLYLSSDTSGPQASVVTFVSESTLVATQPPDRFGQPDAGVERHMTLVMDGTNNKKQNVINKVFDKPFSFDSPVITDVNPKNLPTTGGMLITVAGGNFGLDDTKKYLRAKIGPNSCKSTLWVSGTSITCDPSDAFSGAVSVTADLSAPGTPANYGTYSLTFTYDAPVILSVSGPTATQTGSLGLTFSGTNFGPGETGTRRSPLPPKIAPDQVIVSIGDELCRTSAFISVTSVTCQSIVAANPNTPQRVSVTIGGSVSSYLQLFTTGVRCPNACYEKEGHGTCINDVCRCSQVAGTDRFYQGRDCSLDYCLSNQVYTAEKGQITDHTEMTYWYKPWYQAGNKCSWLLQPQNGNAGMVSLSVGKVDIDPQDSLIVYDGKDATASVLAVLSGKETPPPGTLIRSTGGDMFIALSTPVTGSAVLRNGYTGFFADYTSAKPGCPLDCSSHLGLGKCVASGKGYKCECNTGWRGAGCNVGHSPLDEDFDPRMDEDNWLDVRGGVYKSAVFQFGCGSKPNGGDNLFFTKVKDGRYLISKQLNFEHGGYVSFALKIGSGETDCEKVDDGEEIHLEYSTNFTSATAPVFKLGTYSASGFQNFRTVEVPIPAGTKMKNVYLRWIQPRHDFIKDKDTWALDDVRVVTPFICAYGNDGTMCSGRGSCTATNECSCYEGFIGKACQSACHWNYWHEKECGCPASFS